MGQKIKQQACYKVMESLLKVKKICKTVHNENFKFKLSSSLSQ